MLNQKLLQITIIDIPLLMSSGGNMCPGEFWNFTCEIRDSSILAWEIQNDQYIGPRGSRLEFLSAEPVGTVKYSEINSGVFANLTKNYLQNGVQVLTCELSISELLYHPDDVEVLCVNVGLDTENTYRLTVNCMSIIQLSSLSLSPACTLTNLCLLPSLPSQCYTFSFGL